MESRVVDPLRAAREPLDAGLGQLQLAADAILSAEPAVALAALDTAVDYLTHTFLPVAAAEEFTLYIAIDGLYGASHSTDVMKSQHAAINAMAGDLQQVVKAARHDADPRAYAKYLLPLLHGLYAIIRTHLEAEDDIYLELIDSRMSESQVGVIVDNTARIVAARREGAQPG